MTPERQRNIDAFRALELAWEHHELRESPNELWRVTALRKKSPKTAETIRMTSYFPNEWLAERERKRQKSLGATRVRVVRYSR